MCLLPSRLVFATGSVTEAGTITLPKSGSAQLGRLPAAGKAPSVARSSKLRRGVNQGVDMDSPSAKKNLWNGTLKRNSLFGIPTPESIHPLVSSPALSVRRPSRRRSERRSPACCNTRTAAVIACSTSCSGTAASRGPFRPVSYHRGVYVTPWEPAATRSALPWPQTTAA
jgi:hypothetical protein